MTMPSGVPNASTLQPYCVRKGSTTSLSRRTRPASVVGHSRRSNRGPATCGLPPIDGHQRIDPVGPVRADTVAKVESCTGPNFW
jgi:hypothetical protein